MGNTGETGETEKRDINSMINVKVVCAKQTKKTFKITKPSLQVQNTKFLTHC